VTPSTGTTIRRGWSHPLGEEFPREGFVQPATEAHFASWERDETTTADVVCLDEDTDVTWVIEAKGVNDRRRT
jgi:hypothetical protein